MTDSPVPWVKVCLLWVTDTSPRSSEGSQSEWEEENSTLVVFWQTWGLSPTSHILSHISNLTQLTSTVSERAQSRLGSAWSLSPIWGWRLADIPGKQNRKRLRLPAPLLSQLGNQRSSPYISCPRTSSLFGCTILDPVSARPGEAVMKGALGKRERGLPTPFGSWPQSSVNQNATRVPGKRALPASKPRLKATEPVFCLFACFVLFIIYLFLSDV